MEHGRDPARYSLLCFGGAGPVHAYGVARLLRSPSIIAPALAGVASSLGFLVAPVASEASRSYVARLDRLDWARLNQLLEELEAAGRHFVAEAGVEAASVTVTRTADMQYVGQMHDIAVAVPLGALGQADAGPLREAFQTRYAELFTRTVALAVEALTWRVTVSAAAPPIDLERHVRPSGAAARKGERLAYFAEAHRAVPTAVYDRYALRPGDRLTGPAIIEERESTLVVGPDAQVMMDRYGSLIVDPPAANPREAA
jgi:N-methylhydantoinase A